MDGSYCVVLQSQLGPRVGVLKIKCFSGQILGILQILEHQNTLNGRAEGNSFSAWGSIQTAVSTIPYTMNGTISGNALEAVVKTDFGNMALTGSRILTESEKVL